MSGDLTIRWWHKAFVDGQKSAEFELQGGAPRTVVTRTNINTVTAVIEEDWNLTIQALALALHIPRELICRIMQELSLKCVCAVWVLSVGGGPKSGVTHMPISRPLFG